MSLGRVRSVKFLRTESFSPLFCDYFLFPFRSGKGADSKHILYYTFDLHIFILFLFLFLVQYIDIVCTYGRGFPFPFTFPSSRAHGLFFSEERARVRLELERKLEKEKVQYCRKYEPRMFICNLNL